MEKIYSVAVDGPSGAGKSTLAKAIAAKLHILYVDTGAIYRTIGCYARRQGVDAADTQAVIALLPQVKIGMRYDDQGLQHMLLQGEDGRRAGPYHRGAQGFVGAAGQRRRLLPPYAGAESEKRGADGL